MQLSDTLILGILGFVTTIFTTLYVGRRNQNKAEAVAADLAVTVEKTHLEKQLHLEKQDAKLDKIQDTVNGNTTRLLDRIAELEADALLLRRALLAANRKTKPKLKH